MKLNNNKILKILLTAGIVMGLFLYVFLSIISFNKNNIQANGLILLSETSDIRSILSEYHLQYGEYPRTDGEIILNNKFLCNYSFFDDQKKCEGNILYFNNYDNKFIYEKNIEGTDYNIKFSTNYDSKDLGCYHNKKEKKKGCVFKLTTTGFTVEK